MNLLDQVLVRIPFREVTIRTTINSYSVIERLECGIRPTFRKPSKGPFFTFEGSYHGNYFVLRGHWRNPNGEDAFPNTFYVRIAFLSIPVQIETSPKFYGRVFDDGERGAIIAGHFGIPSPAAALSCVLALLGIAKFYPHWSEIALGLAFLLFIWSFPRLLEFFIEKEGILNFLQGLFYDVIRKE